jgi:hypothetical protein
MFSRGFVCLLHAAILGAASKTIPPMRLSLRTLAFRLHAFWLAAFWLSLASLALVQPAAGQNLVTDGDFEDIKIDNLTGTTFDAIPNQTVKMGAWGLRDTGDRSQFGTGKSGVDLVRGYWIAANNTKQSIDLNGWAKGYIFQDLAADPAKCYTLSFSLAGNPDGGPAVKRVAVYWSPTTMTEGNPPQKVPYYPMSDPTYLVGVFEFDTTGKARNNMGWTTVTATGLKGFTGGTRLTFESLITGPYGPALDEISVRVSNAGVSRWINFDVVDVRSNPPNPGLNQPYALDAYPVGDGPYKDFLKSLPGQPQKLTFTTVVFRQGQREFIEPPFGEFGGGPLTDAFAQGRARFKISGYKYGSFFDVETTRPLIGFQLFLGCSMDSWAAQDDLNRPLARWGGNAFPTVQVNPADRTELQVLGGKLTAPNPNLTGKWLWIRAPRVGFGGLEGQAQLQPR